MRRPLEGGANVDRGVNLALVHYGTFGVTLRI